MATTLQIRLLLFVILVFLALPIFVIFFLMPRFEEAYRLISTKDGAILVVWNPAIDSEPIRRVLEGIFEVAVPGTDFTPTPISVPPGRGMDFPYRLHIQYQLARAIAKSPVKGIITVSTADVVRASLDVATTFRIPTLLTFAIDDALLSHPSNPAPTLAVRLPPPVSRQLDATVQWTLNSGKRSAVVVYEPIFPSAQYAQTLVRRLRAQNLLAFALSLGPSVDFAQHLSALRSQPVEALIFTGSPYYAVDLLYKLNSLCNPPRVLFSARTYAPELRLSVLRYRGAVSLIHPDILPSHYTPLHLYRQYGRDALSPAFPI